MIPSGSTRNPHADRRAARCHGEADARRRAACSTAAIAAAASVILSGVTSVPSQSETTSCDRSWMQPLRSLADDVVDDLIDRCIDRHAIGCSSGAGGSSVVELAVEQACAA